MFHFLQIFDGLEIIYDLLHILPVVHTELEGSLEDTILTGDIDGMDIHVHLSREHLGHLVQQSDAVDTFQLQRSIEEETFVHIPLGIEDAVAIARLELVGYRTGTFVYLYLLFIIDKSKDIISWDGMTTRHEFVCPILSSVMKIGFLRLNFSGTTKSCL